MCNTEQRNAIIITNTQHLCKGVLSVANCRQEVTNFPLAVWVNYIITVMCDVTITDEIRMKPEISNKI